MAPRIPIPVVGVYAADQSSGQENQRQKLLSRARRNGERDLDHAVMELNETIPGQSIGQPWDQHA